MLLSEAFHHYLVYAKYEQGVARSTYLTYASWLHNYELWLQENGYPEPTTEQLDVSVVRRYLHYHGKRDIRPRTMRSIFAPIRALCSFLVDNGIIPTNPMLSIKMPKKDAPIQHTCTTGEILAILRACERLANIREIVLYRAILSTLIFTGIRRAELCDLKVGDINLKESPALLTVRHGKGGGSRTIPIYRDCVTALKEWLAIREAEEKKPTRFKTRSKTGKMKPHTEYLFTQNRTRRVHFNTIYTIFERVKSIAGVPFHKGILPHGLRRAAATRMLENGEDLKVIQMYLGHANIETTAMYLHANERRLLASVNSQALTVDKKHRPEKSFRQDLRHKPPFRNTP